MTQIEADHFSSRCIASWNSHHLPFILQHYALNIHFSSPYAAQITGNSLVIGRKNLEEYCSAAPERFPQLHFSEERAFVGASSVDQRVNNLDAAETMLFEDDGLLSHVWAHYNLAHPSPTIG